MGTGAYGLISLESPILDTPAGGGGGKNNVTEKRVIGKYP